MRSLSILESKKILWEATPAGLLTPPAKATMQESQNNLDIANVCWPFKERRKRRGMGQKENRKKRSMACKALTVLSQELFFFFFLSFLWSIYGWTLWHLICRADETSPCLNWSGFVSSLLSHDPLLYGSVRGGGNPLEYMALVGLLFASYRPTERMLDWSYFMLGLTLSSTLLHRISCFFSSSLFFFFLLYPTAPPIPPFLKPLMQQEGRKASVTVWNYCDFYGGPAVE